MKTIIRNTRCDTTTAKLIGEARYGKTPEDSFTEYLYRTKSGKYFIHAKGGALSRCAGRDATGKPIPGETIDIVTAKTAADWIMDNIGPVEDYYLARDEGEREWATIKIPLSTKKTIEALKESTGKTVGQIVSEAIASYMA